MISDDFFQNFFFGDILISFIIKKGALLFLLFLLTVNFTPKPISKLANKMFFEIFSIS
jgi:hypothetical protein